MHDVIVMKVIDSLQDFLDRPGGVFLSEFAVLTDTVE